MLHCSSLFRVVRSYRHHFFALLFALGLALSVSAQVESTGVGGSVTDPAGGVVRGATITVRNTETNVTKTATSNSAGLYQFSDLEAGNYELTATAEGFSEAKTNSFALHVGAPIRLDLKLKVGSVTVTVDVSDAQADVLNTTNNSVNFNIDNRQIDNLPINERNLFELVALQPGVSTENDGGTAQNSRGGFEVNGAPGLANNILLDGVDGTFGEDNGAGSGVTGTIGPVINTVGVNSISEFRTTTSVPPAEYGRALGGILTINTKSGTNKFHGRAFEYFRNDIMDANFYFNKHTLPIVTVPKLRFNLFGANIGGPIKRNHIFFFANYEAARQIQGSAHVFDTPNEAFFLGVKDPNVLQELRTMMRGNVYPHPSNLNFYMDQWKGNLTNFEFENTGLVHLDFNYGKHHEMVRVAVNDQNQGIQQTYRMNDNLLYPLRSYNVGLQDDWTLKPNLLNSFRFGMNRNDLDRNTTTYHTDPFKTIISLDNYFSTASNPAELHFITTTYSLVDNITWVRGRHNYVFGTDNRSLRSLRIQDGLSSVSYNSITSTWNNTPYSVSMQFGGHKHFSAYQLAFYAQDSWRASPRLTLNYGVRYEKYTPLRGAFNVVSSDPFGPINPSSNAPFSSENNLNFAPRLGFIDDLTGKGKLLFSGGFGLMFIPPQPFFYYDTGSLSPALPLYVASLTSADVPSTFNFHFPISKDFVQSIITDPTQAAGFRLGRIVADPHHQDEYGINWNAQLQYQARKDLTLKAIYTAMRSLHGQAITQPNQFANGACPTPTTCTVRPNPAFGNINYSEYLGRIWYDGVYLQASLRNRLANANVYYAYAADILTWGENNQAGGSNTLVQDLSNPDLSRGPAQGSVRNRIRGDFTMSPRVHGYLRRHRASRWALDGYDIQGIVSFTTGQALNVVTSVDLVHNGRTNVDRPDRVPGVSLYSNSPGTGTYPQYLNAAGFDIATPTAQQRYGTLGFDSVYGPHQINFNASLLRTITFRDRTNLRLRFEAFNVLNHANYGSPNVNVSSSQFGEITSTSSPRNLQLGAEYRF